LIYVKSYFYRLAELCGKFIAMNTLLWSFQGIVAVVFLYSGLNKSILNQQTLIGKGQTGVTGLHMGFIRFIGISEVLGAMGLIFPFWLRIAPVLTPVAAGCFAVIMILAAVTHTRLLLRTGNKRELQNIATNIVLLSLSVAIAWGRLAGL
jgi:hypothetical protein